MKAKIDLKRYRDSDIRSKKKLELLNRIHKLDANTRGTYLIQANWIETFLSDSIAAHFAPNNKSREHMLESLVLREISFNAKIRIFSKLIKLHYPEITHTFPSFLKDLNKVRETRNRYAHSVIDLRDNFLRLNKHNTLRYQIHQDGKKVHSDMTKKELEEELSIAQGVTEQISMILNYVSEEAKTR